MKIITHTIFPFFLLCAISCQNIQKDKSPIIEVKDSVDTQQVIQVIPTDSKPKIDTTIIRPAPIRKDEGDQSIPTKNSPKYRLRKYDNVTQFYSRIAKSTTTICMENNVPPAAILAIAGLESGWNQGYIGRITGNILSLGTRKGDRELPALRLPRLKSDKRILFDSLEILKYRSDEVFLEDRPPSLKKDYRPAPYAGTKYNLAYFKYHPDEKAQANIANLTDFVTVFLSRKSRIPVYREARKKMDDLVEVHGKEILLKEETAIQFVKAIGGKPYSFNFRETWPVKVTTIIKKAGLAQLTTELYDNNVRFEDAW